MGLYRFPPLETTDANGILKVGPPLANIPNDLDNSDWQVYLVWKNIPNTPDAAIAESIANLRIEAKRTVDTQCDVELEPHITAFTPGARFLVAQVEEEALREVDAATKTSAEFPMLFTVGAAEAPTRSIVEFAGDYRTEMATRKGDFADIETVRRQAHVDIDAAADAAALIAVLAAITWP